MNVCRRCGKKLASEKRWCNQCREKHRQLIIGRKRADHEPTQEEVDAIIAEQMSNLPSWWNRSKEQMEMGMEE